MNAHLDVSVVICAYTQERWDELEMAVESVHRQTYPPREIIVVIDYNPELLEKTSRRIANVQVVENTHRQGLSGARNSGIAKAQSSIVAFLDEDAVAARDWLQQLVSSYAEPQVAGVGGVIEAVWSNDPPPWFPEEFKWVVGCTYRGLPLSPMPVRNLIGCNMSFRREVFETIGGFQDGIGRIGTRPLGCEETELCIRAKQSHPQSVFLYQPSARVFHRVTPIRSSWRYFVSRCYAEGLSKAIIAERVGAGDSLASERTYVTTTLPRGIMRGLRDAVKSDLVGLARSAAIVLGVTCTVTGYLVGVLSHQNANSSIEGRASR